MRGLASILTAAMVSLPVIAFSQVWQFQNTLPTGNSLRSVSAANGTTAFAVGTGGIILKTVNGGKTWTHQPIGIKRDMNAVAAVSPDTAFAVGDTGVILKTTDGGATWRVQTSNSKASLHAVSPIDGDTAFAGGYGGIMDAESVVLRTIDGGKTWSRINQSFPTIPVVTLSAVNSNTIFVSTGGFSGIPAVVRRTTNAGVTWEVIRNSSGQSYTGLSALDSNTVFLTAGMNNARTVDGGKSWSGNPTSGSIIDLVAMDPQSAIGVGAFGFVASTRDGGLNWATGSVGTEDHLSSVSPVGWDTLFTVGGGGTIFTTTNGGANWVSRRQGTTPDLMSISALGGGVVLASGDSGVLMPSADGWVRRKTRLGPVPSVAAASRNVAYAAGRNSGIAKSTDGGETWKVQQLPALFDVNTVLPLDENTVFAGGVRAILRTRNGGENWASLNIGAAEATIYSLASPDGMTVLAVGFSGLVLRSTDGGETWSSPPALTTRALRAVTTPDTRTAFAVGDNGLVFKSLDGGATWERKPTPTGETLRAVVAWDATTVFVAGTRGTLLESRDGGTTWTHQNTVTFRDLSALAISPEGILWAAGDFGTIIKTTSAPVSTFKNEPRLSQRGPYRIERGIFIRSQGPMTLRIQDLLGRQMTTLGPDGPDLPPGAYILSPP